MERDKEALQFNKEGQKGENVTFRGDDNILANNNELITLKQVHILTCICKSINLL